MFHYLRNRSTFVRDDGVPQAMASIITKPKGSGQSMETAMRRHFLKIVLLLVGDFADPF